MAGGQDFQIRKVVTTSGREIKASSHYTYIQNGITLAGAKFAVGELVLEGQALIKDDVTGKYEKYADVTGAFPTGKSNPVILDESIQFRVTDAGVNPDTIAGQVIVHGSVHAGMCKNVTAAFKTAVGGSIRFV